MGIKKFNPTSPGRRQMTILTNEDLTRKKPEKGLLTYIKSSGGRNNGGRISVRFRGGGHKRMYRHLDFKRDKPNVLARVAALEYDPNRSARLALLHYADGEKRYILAPVGLEVGQSLMSGEGSEVRNGNCLALRNLPLGTNVHNVELTPGRGGQMARGAGSFCQLMAK